MLTGAYAAGIRAFDADGACRFERRADIIDDRGVAFIVAKCAQEKVIVAENGQESLIDDRDVREFEMGVQSLMRQDGGFDDRGIAYLRIKTASFES